jgi:hypothetical protein
MVVVSEDGSMARKSILSALLGGLACMSATAAGPLAGDFERMLPADYRALLLKARNAYDGKRYDEAFRGFQRAACAGDKESQSAVGRMYLLGQGVARDDLVGYAWLKVAAEIRSLGYQSIVKKLDAAMTPEQHRIADPEAEKLIGLYGMRATNMSCNTTASRGGHVIDSIACTPQYDGGSLLLKQCVSPAKAPAPGG